MEAYEAGQRIFGENRPQEMAQKYEELPKDIEWHLIGHLQTNKVKMVVPFVAMIHSLDSVRLAEAIQKAAAAAGRTIDVLLEIHVADEESKIGLGVGGIAGIRSQRRLCTAAQPAGAGCHGRGDQHRRRAGHPAGFRRFATV